MKFFISYLITFSCWASPINIFHEGPINEAEALKSILTLDYQVPEELIHLNRIDICETMKPIGKLDMCLKNNGDLYMVSVDREFIDESLKVFRAQQERL